MTWFNEDVRHQEYSSHTKARQRMEQLKRDSRQMMEVGETQMLVLWPMSGWQIWRRVDKVWCEYVMDCVSLEAGIEAARRLAKER